MKVTLLEMLEESEGRCCCCEVSDGYAQNFLE